MGVLGWPRLGVADPHAGAEEQKNIPRGRRGGSSQIAAVSSIHRNTKKVIKQSLQSRPGPQDEPLDRSLLETILIMSAYIMNSTPYLSDENKELLAPIDLIAPWNGASVQIRELPDSTLTDLVSERRALLVRLESLLELQ